MAKRLVAAPDIEAVLSILRASVDLGDAGRRLRHEFPDLPEAVLLSALREGCRRRDRRPAQRRDGDPQHDNGEPSASGGEQ